MKNTIINTSILASDVMAFIVTLALLIFTVDLFGTYGESPIAVVAVFIVLAPVVAAFRTKVYRLMSIGSLKRISNAVASNMGSCVCVAISVTSSSS